MNSNSGIYTFSLVSLLVFLFLFVKMHYFINISCIIVHIVQVT